jgi:hypothetical protein
MPRNYTAEALLISAMFLSACSQTSPTELEPRPSFFGACEDEFTVSLDSVEDRSYHPSFSYLKLPDIGDELRPMDHAIVIDDHNAVHCIWIRGGNWIAGEGVNFGHASSSDMVNWTVYPHISVESSTHRIDRIWAPQVIYEDSIWNMYFTGVTLESTPANNIQRIFVSTSADLQTWSEARLVLEPRHEQLAWGTGTAWANDARDQMVFSHDGTMKMLLTVRLHEGNQTLALAQRTNGIWEVSVVLESLQGEVVESPFLYQHDGKLYITINNWRDGGQQIWSSTTLLGAWTKEPVELRGFAFEFLELDSGYLMASRVWSDRAILFTQFDFSDFESTNMIFPSCYVGGNELFKTGDNIIVVGRT